MTEFQLENMPLSHVVFSYCQLNVLDYNVDLLILHLWSNRLK
jgi:hypothetical protein